MPAEGDRLEQFAHLVGRGSSNLKRRRRGGPNRVVVCLAAGQQADAAVHQKAAWPGIAEHVKPAAWPASATAVKSTWAVMSHGETRPPQRVVVAALAVVAAHRAACVAGGRIVARQAVVDQQQCAVPQDAPHSATQARAARPISPR